MKIKIQYPKVMRYETLGDYFYGPDGELIFQMWDTGNKLYNWLILIHEMIEYVLSMMQGVTIEQIDEYDLNHDGSIDLGDEPDCPIRNHHCFALAVERLICAFLGVSWKEYNDVYLENIKIKYRKQKK